MSKTEKRAAEVIEQAVTGEELDSDKEPEAIETLNKFEAPRSNFGLLHTQCFSMCSGWFGRLVRVDRSADYETLDGVCGRGNSVR